jgi:nucleoside-diphosphate-sugar epimerase
MKTLVTGATGLVGHAVVDKLRARGHQVRALVRDPSRAERLLPDVELVRGDITDRASVLAATRGMDWVFHAAGMPEQWQADPDIFDRVNRGGTANVLDAAYEAGVKRAVYTSTMDVFAAPTGGTLVETHLDPEPKHSVYERSKQAADREAERVRHKGLDVVHVNPSAVYGPSPVHVGLNSFFIRLLTRKAPMLPPGGMSVVFVDGCAEAHVAAAERGTSGERYLISDTFVENRQLAEAVVRYAKLPRVPPAAPVWLMRAAAAVGEPIARALGRPPLIAHGQLEFLLWRARVNNEKAQRELGFVPQSLERGVRETVDFLRAEKLAP